MEIKKFIMLEALTKVIKEAKEDYEKDNSGIRPSNSGSCTRKIWYQYHHQKPDILIELEEKGGDIEDLLYSNPLNYSKARSSLVFELGNIVESQLVKRMGDKLTNTQLTCAIATPNYTMTGAIDGIYTDRYENKWIIDFKSINTLGFKNIFKYRKTGADLNIDYKYKCQANCYMKALDIPRFIFVYYDKNISDIEEAPIVFDQNIYNQIVDRFNKAISDVIADREYEPGGRDGWNCIEEGTLVKCLKEWKKIEDIKKGDSVLTSTGYNKVLKTHNNGEKETILIKPRLLLPYRCTPDHEILTHSSSSKSKPKYIKAEFIKTTDKLRAIFKIDNTVDKTDITDDELFMLSAFISDGHYCVQDNINKKIFKCGITLNSNKKDIANKLKTIALKHGATSVKIETCLDNRAIKQRSSLKINIYGVNFIKFLNKYLNGGYSYSKTFKDNIMNMEHEKQASLLKHLLLFDGCKQMVRKSLCHSYSTVCKEKALQIQMLHFRLGKIASINIQKAKEKDFGYGKLYNCRELYHVRYFPNSKRSVGKIKDNILTTIIENRGNIETKNVYDLSIEKTPDYLTQGGIVHNCTYCQFFKTCWGHKYNIIIEKGKPKAVEVNK